MKDSLLQADAFGLMADKQDSRAVRISNLPLKSPAANVAMTPMNNNLIALNEDYFNDRKRMNSFAVSQARSDMVSNSPKTVAQIEKQDSIGFQDSTPSLIVSEIDVDAKLEIKRTGSTVSENTAMWEHASGMGE